VWVFAGGDADTHVFLANGAAGCEVRQLACVLQLTQNMLLLLLLLQVADGSYAFVLHTANPLTGQLGEMFGELVPGLGEVLVS
jgi:hypothetical protein